MRELSCDSYFFFKWLSSELFHAVHRVLKTKILKWFAIPFSSGPHFVLGFKITADGDCSHERCLLLGRKAMINPDSILKSRDITLPTKACLVKAMDQKKAECWRIYAFELWCWRRLESPLDCKAVQPVHLKGNQSWIFIGRTDTEAETPIFWPPDEKRTHLKRPWCWERLRAGGEGDDRGWDGWMASLTRWREFE